MTERDLHTFLVKAFHDRDASAYKIPDPQFGEKIDEATGKKKRIRFAHPRPYDGLGAYRGHAYVWEGKYLKGYQSLPLSAVEPHQWENLLKMAVGGPPGLHALIVVGIYLPRIGWDVFFFDVRRLWAEKLEGRLSVTRAEFHHLREAGYYLPYRKGAIEIEMIPEVIVKPLL